MAKTEKGCVDDLATLSELNEEIILQELQARYKQDVIYVRKILSRHRLEYEWYSMQICLRSVHLIVELVMLLVKIP